MGKISKNYRTSYKGWFEVKKVSIIIPTYNNLEYTKKCLEAIRKKTNKELYEIIVVDNASSDDTPLFLKSQKDIVYILNKKNNNFSGACNQGADIAKGEIFLFLNNDTEVHENWLEPLIDIIKKEKMIGAVGSKLLFSDGKIQHAGIAVFDSKIPEHIYRLSPANKKYVNKRREFQAVTAACIAIPKNIFDQVGGFDEYYRNGYEDMDLCFKIGKAGYKIIYEPKSVVTHHESISPGIHTYLIKNLDLLMSRWWKIKSDANNYFEDDGFSRIQKLFLNVKYMAYEPQKYNTIPNKILKLRKIYLLIIKTNLFIKRQIGKFFNRKKDE